MTLDDELRSLVLEALEASHEPLELVAWVGAGNVAVLPLRTLAASLRRAHRRLGLPAALAARVVRQARAAAGRGLPIVCTTDRHYVGFVPWPSAVHGEVAA